MKVLEDFQIKEELWYKIGGVAKYFIVCQSREDIIEAIDFVQKNQVDKIQVVGLGSNLVFTDNYFNGAVIKIISGDENSIRITTEGLVEVFSGVVVDDFIKFSFANNLVGLEWGGGLPGTVGGAVRGNAGAYGGEIKDTLVSAEILDYSGGQPIIKTLSNEDLQFSYRNSLIKQNKKIIVVSARFNLRKATDEEIEKAHEVYNKNTQNRKDKHPLEYPNTGSVFINPREKEQIEKILSIYPDLRESVEQKWYGKVAVATLIDRWGLKGFRIGDAQISEKHALFIVNLGHAKAEEVLGIIAKVKQKFFDTFGFPLETEVEIVN